MSFPRYENYCDSGVEWLGEVPAVWKTARLKAVVEIKKRIAGREGPDVLSITQRGIKVRDTGSNDGQLAEDYSHYQLVEPGDFAMNQMDLITGWVDIAQQHGVTSPDYRVFGLRPTTTLEPRFLLYILQHGYQQRIFFAYGQGASHLGRWRLPTDAFENFLIPIPSKEEQRYVVDFLDHEMAKTDKLVEEQRQLIALLKEKRQAVISHAVTKGLDPSVPMKDSGIKWLGEIPAHWATTPLKNVVQRIVDCLHTTPTYDGELVYPAVRTADVDRGRLLLSGALLVSREVYEERIQRLKPEANDVLYSREGERFGMAALVPQDVDLCLGQRMMMFRTSSAMDPAFLMWVLNSDSVYQQVLSGLMGATSPHVNISDIRNFVLPLPPVSEQASIVHAIASQIDSADLLVAEAEKATLVLQERRAALISAAVTGKIDVRNLGSSSARAEAA